MRRLQWLLTVLAASASAASTSAQAPDEQTPAAQTPDEQTTTQAASTGVAPAPYTLSGYVEAFYQWNFNRPFNDITNYRAFDNRHSTFTLANVALDAQWDYQNLIGRLTLQIGHTPSTYYMAEPVREGSSGANASDLTLWKYLQQAYAGYRFFDRLTVATGIFLSPTGPEALAIKDSWNWSRANLFFGLPFYHTGARASYALTDAWSITLAAYNGWNSVVDNNREKSLAAQITFTRPKLAASLLYFGGVERARGALEGQPWRHMTEAHATATITSWLSLIGHVNAGVERTRFGNARWAAAAAYARAQLLPPLSLAVRGDFFREHAPQNARGRASPLFWPVARVSSLTTTLDYRPHQRVSFRAEYRHDRAADALFFAGRNDPNVEPAMALPTRRKQNTLTLGVTSWF